MTVEVVTEGNGSGPRRLPFPSSLSITILVLPPAGITGRLIDRVVTSSSPARLEIDSRVFTSPIPGSTTVVPRSRLGVVMRRENPRLVVGTGGDASGLTLAYAIAHRVPIAQQIADSHSS